jgi:tRNA A-37 threonylcarbamoyl transferase component Bud32
VVEPGSPTVACPLCSAPVAEEHRFCPACGTSLDLPDSPTGTAPRPAGRGTPSPSPAEGPRGAAGPGRERFVPGTLLGERYRLVGLLGRGGMGEVYRADDLKLDQAVALKFLPPALERDPDRLARLYGEVRIARQISHPAVCRVWDIGEADGRHFLSMEFVDGENLASLLRRIGRFPPDKATDIARQVAAGLAAAHEKGVLHRDLKPANVMLDGQGKVRITDFGLAGLADSFRAEDVRSGTPSYMSPEQLQGREVSVRSDVYSLGLLIYELVTGRRAFPGKDLAEITRRHREEKPIEPSVIVPDLDPAVERTIFACLEKDPRKRPPSALVVQAMLGGRDPLEAAIAAGETPSPELVAAAGESEGLRPRLAVACFSAVLLGVLLVPALQPTVSLFGMIPAEKSPAALEDRARDLVARLGTVVAADREVGFGYDWDYVRWTQQRDHTPSRWASLRTGEPPVLQFWYRQSPRPLAPTSINGRVDWNDPPTQVSGMTGVAYDLEGRLLSFYRVPPQLEEDGAPSPEVNWAPVFAEAQLDLARFRRVEPRWTPPFYCDSRAAWEGSWPRRPEIPLRIEAAGYRGRPVWFQVVSPWTRPERQEPVQYTRSERVGQGAVILLVVALVSAGALLARRNLRLGRGDRRGAFRLSVVLLGLALGAWVFRAHHVADPSAEMLLCARGAGLAILGAALVWLFYLALEPYVRRLRPWTLISWNRLLNGGLRDAVVGRDVLIGMAWGTMLALVYIGAHLLAVQLGRPEPLPEAGLADALLGARLRLSYLIGLPVNAALEGLGILLLFLILRLATRRDSVAALLLTVLLSGIDLASADDRTWVILVLFLLAWGSFVALLLRFGVLAAITGVYTVALLSVPPQSYDLGEWTGAATAYVLPLLIVLAVLAFRSSVGGHLGLLRPPGEDVGSSGSS